MIIATRADGPEEQTTDLPLLARFVRAGEQMDQAEDMDELWTVVAAEAAGLLGASAKVMQWTGRLWVVLVEHPVAESAQDESAIASAQAVQSIGADPDAMDDPVTFPRLGLVGGHARSVLVTDLGCAELQAPTRLVWTSPGKDAFGAAADLAAEYTRFTDSAVRRTHARIHLQRAVTARHRVGQAQGIVMVRLELAAADAFDLLMRRSQNTNVKLSVLSDQVIHSSELESAAVAGAHPAGIEVWGADHLADVASFDEIPGITPPGTLRAVDDPAPDTNVIAPELSDAIGNVIVTGSGDAAGRAEVMCALIEEMRASTEWLNAAGSREELRSLQPAVTAIHEHLHRMLRLAAVETS